MKKNFVIYPKGHNGERLGWLLETLYPECEILYIDDSSPETSLEGQKENIKPDSLVLLTSTKHEKLLQERIKTFGIANIYNGIDFGANEIKKRLIEIRKIDPKQKQIGIMMTCITGEAHMFGIDEALKENGNSIIYFVPNKTMWDRYREKGVCFIVSSAILEKINSLDMMIINNGEWTSPDVMTIDLTHHFQGVSYIALESGTDWEYFIQGVKNTNFTLCGSPKIVNVYQEFFDKFGLKSKPLPLGYPKLDSDIKRYESKDRITDNLVFFAFNDLVSIENIISLAKLLLEGGYRVCYSPHPATSSDEETEMIRKYFASENGFFILPKHQDKMELFGESICCLSDSSSLGYTFPLTTLKPCVIIGDDEYMSKSFGKEHYFEPPLHIFCDDISKIKFIVDEIKINQESYRRKIKNYRDKNCFNLGKSKEAILDWILEKIQS